MKRVGVGVFCVAVGAQGCVPKSAGFEDLDELEGDGSGDDGEAGDGGEDGEGPGPVPAGPIDPDPTYVERSAQALEAWDLGLASDLLAGGRELGDAYTAHHPDNWITVSDESCDALGIGPALRDNCPLGSGPAGQEIIGVCETRVFPTGEIVDTTLVVWDGFQEVDMEESEKRAVFVHEVGHCLGLKHRNNKQAVMYPTIAGSDMPSDEERQALTEVYTPIAEPSNGTAQRFFSESAAGEPLRHHEFPKFYISGSIGVETASVWVPSLGPRLGGPLTTVTHYIRRDGGCGSY